MSRSTNARGAGKANTSASAVGNESSFESSALSNVLDENVRLMQQLRSEFKEMEMLKLVAERRRDVYAIVEEEHAAKLAAVPLPQPVPAGALPTDPSTDQLQSALSSLQQLYVHFEPNPSSPRSMARALQEAPGSPTLAADRQQHSGRSLGPPHSDFGSPGLSSSSSVLDAVQSEVASLERDGMHGSLRDAVRARRNTEGESRRAQALLDLTVQQSSHAAVRARAGVDRSTAHLELAVQGGTASGSPVRRGAGQDHEQLPLYQALPPMSPSAWLAEPVLFGAASAALSSPGPSRSEITLALTQTPAAQGQAQEQGRAPAGLTFAKALAEAEAAQARGDAPVLLAPSLAARGMKTSSDEVGGPAQTQTQSQSQVEAGDGPHTSSRPKRAAPSVREAQKKEILAQLFAAADASAAEEAAQERAMAEARTMGDSSVGAAPTLVSSPTAGSSSASSRVRDVSELRALSRSTGGRGATASSSSSASSSPAPASEPSQTQQQEKEKERAQVGLLMSPVQAIILSKLPQPARAPPAPGAGRRADAATAPPATTSAGAGAGGVGGGGAPEGTLLSPEWEALLHDLESAAGAWKQGLEGQGGAEVESSAAPAAAADTPAPADTPAEAPVEAPVDAGDTAEPPAPAAPVASAQAAVRAGVGAGTGALLSSSPFAARVAAARRAGQGGAGQAGGLLAALHSPLPRAPLRATPAYAGPTASAPAGPSASVSLSAGGESSPPPSASAPPSVFAVDGQAVGGLAEEGDGRTAAAMATAERAHDVSEEGAATEAHVVVQSSSTGSGLYAHEEAGVWAGRDSPALEWLEPVPASAPLNHPQTMAGGGSSLLTGSMADGGSASGALEARRDLINSVRKGPKAWRSPRSAPTSPLLASPGSLLSFTVAGSGGARAGAGAGAGGVGVTSPTAALLSAGSRIVRERERAVREREAAARAQGALAETEKREERRSSPAVEQRLAFTLAAQTAPPPVDPRPSLSGMGLGSAPAPAPGISVRIGGQQEEAAAAAAPIPPAGKLAPYPLHHAGAVQPLGPTAPSLMRPEGSSGGAAAAHSEEEEEEMVEQSQEQDEGQGPAGGPESTHSPTAAGLHEEQVAMGQQQEEEEEEEEERQGPRRTGQLQEIQEVQEGIGGAGSSSGGVPAVGPGSLGRKKRRRLLPSLFWLCSGVTSVENGPGRSGRAVGHAAQAAQARARRDSWVHGGTGTGTGTALASP